MRFGGRQDRVFMLNWRPTASGEYQAIVKIYMRLERRANSLRGKDPIRIH